MINHFFKKNPLLKNFIDYCYGPLGKGFIGVLSVPILSWIISPEEYGKAGLFLGASIIISSICSLGLNRGYSREYHEQQDKIKLLSTCLYPTVIFALMVALSLFIFRDHTASILFGNKDILSSSLLIIVALATPFIMFSQTILIMEERAKMSSFLLILWRLIEFSTTILLLVFVSKKYTSLIYSQVFAIIALALIGTYVTRQHWSFKKSIRIDILKKLLKFSIPISIATILMLIMAYINSFLLRKWATFNHVGVYENAMKFAFAFALLKDAFGRFWTSTQYLWLKNKQASREYLYINTLLSASLAILFAFTVLFKNIIFLFISPEYYHAIKIFPFLALSIIIYTYVEGISYNINFSRKTYWFLFIAIISISINVMIAKPLILSYAALGASISLVISTTIFYLLHSITAKCLWSHSFCPLHTINIVLMIGLCFSSIINISDFIFSGIILATNATIIYYSLTHRNDEK